MDLNNNIILDALNSELDSKFLEKFEKENKDIWTTELRYFKEEYTKNKPKILLKKGKERQFAVLRPSLQWKYESELVDFKFAFAEKLVNMIVKGMK